MRIMMTDAHLAEPTFESDRGANTFTIRLLLHHFLGEDDIIWLKRFECYNLDDNQKKALIFLRETEAIDNLAYRQLSGEDTLHASVALRELRDIGLIEQKGRGNSTYYIPTEILFQDDMLKLQDSDSSMQDNDVTMQDNDSSMQDSKLVEEVLKRLKMRLNFAVLSQIIVDLCKIKGFERVELSALIKRDETYVRTILTKLVKSGRLKMKYPEMPKHPHQAYIATETE